MLREEQNYIQEDKPMISVKQYGDYKRFQKWCHNLDENSKSASKILEKYGQLGCDELEKTTPKRTGLTSRSWVYDISYDKNGVTITWHNTNIQNGKNIALLIFNGHGTGSGHWVEGVDYINPAMKPVFDEIGESIKKEVFKA